MMIDKDLLIYLPFDDPDGSVAYDYSKYRKDGVLSGGAFLSRADAKVGKSLDMNMSGNCDVPFDIPFSGDFTVCFFYKSSTKDIGWILNFSGLNNYVEYWTTVVPGEWVFYSFVKSGIIFTASVNGVAVQTITLSSPIVGLSLNDTNVVKMEGSFDEFMVFWKAKSAAELRLLQFRSSDVEYLVDGVNFKDFGVYVSASNGLFGMLERKEALTVDYDNYHGVVVDKSRPRYKERTITLDCFIESSGKASFVEWVQMFMRQFQKPGTQRLKVSYDGLSKPLVYEVYCPSQSDVEKSWTYSNELMVGKFQLKLVECEPVKRVLRYVGDAGVASITVSSSKMLNVYWGDGTHSYDVSGNNVTVTHAYDTEGEYDIVITGVIEDISAFSTNCIVVWDKLL